MARDDTPLDQETFDRVLAEELGKGVDRRVAEGRARSAAVRAARAKSGEAPAATPAARRPRRRRRRWRRRRPPHQLAAPAPRPFRLPFPPPLRSPPRRSPSGPPPRRSPRPSARRLAPSGNVPEPKKGAPEKHRLLALVPPEGIQRVEREQGDRINVWPHLLIEEFVAMMIVLAALTIFATFVNAPLRELANPNLTPNPSKAPWYFLGLQELLRYFHPMVAGVLFAPTLVLLALAVAPFVDRNPSIKPGDRKVAITLFTMLIMFGAVLTIIGSFFRGTGYNWVWPWAQGVFFEL